MILTDYYTSKCLQNEFFLMCFFQYNAVQQNNIWKWKAFKILQEFRLIFRLNPALTRHFSKS